jgi:hypothetical protein
VHADALRFGQCTCTGYMYKLLYSCQMSGSITTEEQRAGPIHETSDMQLLMRPGVTITHATCHVLLLFAALQART